MQCRVTDTNMVINCNIYSCFNDAVLLHQWSSNIFPQTCIPGILCHVPVFALDPTFISSSFIPDEEKIYFFFSEVGREYDFIDKFIVSRVSQICMVRIKQWASCKEHTSNLRQVGKLSNFFVIRIFHLGTNEIVYR